MRSDRSIRRALAAGWVLLGLTVLAAVGAMVCTAVRMQIAMFAAVPPEQAEELLLRCGTGEAYTQGLAVLRMAGYGWTGGRFLLALTARALLWSIPAALVLALCLLLLRRHRAGAAAEIDGLCAAMEEQRPPAPPETPELQGLAAGLRRLLRRHQIETEQLKSDKEQLGRFAQNVYHQIKTPLTGLRIQLELLGETEEQQTCLHLVDALSEKVGLLLRLGQLEAKAVKMEMRRQSVSALLGEALEAVEPLIRSRGTAVHLDIPEGVQCACHGFWLREALENLLKNACENAGSSLSVTLRETAASVTVTIHSDGDYPAEGITVERYASRRTGGTGLGVYIAAEVAAQHFGHLVFAPGPEGGTDAVVTLPKISSSLS